jgi:hypothetical protein
VDFLHVKFHLEVEFEERPSESLHKFTFNLRISDREFETPGYYRADSLNIWPAGWMHVSLP